MFPRCLINICGFVLDSKSRDELSTYYLEKESGMSYVRHNTFNNEISFSENDIVVNNINDGDYELSIKSRVRVEATIVALDILLELLYDPKYTL